jgi:ribosomal protein S18 acetylase RimI-like enzyme
MEESKIKLKWNRATKYEISLHPRGRKPREFSILINGDPKLDEENKCVANMGVWLDTGIIYHLYVQPEWRNKGIGKRMLREGEKKIIRMGKTQIGILVDRMNSNTVSFYERRGYEMTDERMIGHNIMRKECKGD